MSEQELGRASTDQLLGGLLALQIADRDERAASASGVKTSEVILSRAGFNAREIAALTGRQYEAVRSALRREAKKNGEKGADVND